MLYSYSGFPDRSFFVFAKSEDSETAKEQTARVDTCNVSVSQLEKVSDDKDGVQNEKDNDLNELPQEAQSVVVPEGHASDSAMARDMRVKMNMLSGLSIILTLMSILVAFRYDYSLAIFHCLDDGSGS